MAFYKDQLREFREARKMTQSELAKIIGVTGQTISNWENKKSKKNPSRDYIIMLADALGVTVQDISDGRPTMKCIKLAEGEIEIPQDWPQDGISKDILNAIPELTYKQKMKIMEYIEDIRLKKNPAGVLPRDDCSASGGDAGTNQQTG